MRPTNFPAQILARVDEQTREAVEELAYANRWSMAEAVRELLNDGLHARGLID